jgi:glycosyltransferase involved in cell wall biosynthesis
VDEILTGLAEEEIATGAHAPLVTIVIVNHNYGEFVEQCIRSVDQQDYPDIQCIVMDFASSDNSLAVIEAILNQTRNSFFQLLRRDVNHGHLINSLSALDDITGDFITFLDSDDFLFPEFVSTHVKAHLNDVSSAALSVTDQIQVDSAGQVLAGTCHWHQKWRAFEPGTA